MSSDELSRVLTKSWKGILIVAFLVFVSGIILAIIGIPNYQEGRMVMGGVIMSFGAIFFYPWETNTFALVRNSIVGMFVVLGSLLIIIGVLG